MRSIAVTVTHEPPLEQLRLGFPDAELLHLTLEQVERSARKRRLSALLVDPTPLGDRVAVRVAMLKDRHRELAIVAFFPPGADLARRVLAVAHANVDRVVIGGTEDRPDHFRQAFADAAVSCVAHVARRACYPLPPLAVVPNLVHAIAGIARIHDVRAFASALGVGVATLRTAFRPTRRSPRTFLKLLRVLNAGRHLGDSALTVRRVATLVGYASDIPLENAFREVLGCTCGDVRDAGGLWRASELAYARFAALTGRAA